MKIPKGNDDWGREGGAGRERDEKERKEEWKGLGKAARDLPRFLPNFARMLQWRKFERILRRPGNRNVSPNFVQRLEVASRQSF